MKQLKRSIITVVTLCMMLFTMSGCQESKQAETIIKDITITSKRNTEIHASVYVPDKEDAPLVVMAHGFVGDRSGCGSFEPLAKTLGEKGIASIRIDFPGNGESKESYTAYTLRNMQDDIDSVISYMTKTYATSKTKKGIVGHSMGGRIASLYANDDITATALWAPAANDGLQGLADFMGGMEEVVNLYEEAKVNGKAAFTQWGEPFVDCSKIFFEENEKSSPLSNIATYKGALMIAVAGHDDYVSKETTNAVIQHANKIEVLNLKNADHVFDDVEKSSPTSRDTLVNETAKFFERNLK